MDFYLDTEFYDDGWNPPQPISLGLLCENGAEFYWENRMFAWHALSEADNENAAWLMDNVRPHLWQTPFTDRPLPLPSRPWDRKVVHGGYVDPRVGGEMLRLFVNQQCDLADGGNSMPKSRLQLPTFWTWYGAYDWFLLCRLVGPNLLDLPRAWPHLDLDLRQEAIRLGFTTHNVKEQIIRPDETPAHHALHDCHWNREVHRVLKDAER